ncbi:iron-containing alcohol dehydrogenase [Rhodobacterales bacterium HKCCE3408]|nr:iron-containing alcohol dehydrogenase [Rhodobacterales bacterium HKCCE3408]
MIAFTLLTPGKTIFGPGCRSEAAKEVAARGKRALLVRGRSVAWVERLIGELRDSGVTLLETFSGGEPTLDQIRDALRAARDFRPDWVVAVGGGATIDMGKALSALLNSDHDPLAHLEVVGDGIPIGPDPLPFLAMPTTSGTGAEATKNAVIAIPEHSIKVSLRDDRMIPDVAIVDPELTHGAPQTLTLATGLDAITQLIESYLSIRANPATDAICSSTIPAATAALVRLMEREDAEARLQLSRASYLSGVALASAGLGIVHGLAAVIGGIGGAHGAICGRLLPAALEINARVAASGANDMSRFEQVDQWLSEGLDAPDQSGTAALSAFIDRYNLDPLPIGPDMFPAVAQAALKASSTRANPVQLNQSQIAQILSLSM